MSGVDDMPVRSQVLDLFALAIADGFVSPEELALIHERGRELGLTSQQVEEVIANPDNVAFVAPSSLTDAIIRLYDLSCVLISDGVVDPREVQVLRSYAERFGVREKLVDPIVATLIDEVRAGTPREKLIADLSGVLHP
jgi:uncharacterized membrane protein YebE (DUF533 family)